eukprot:2533314-Rhodomonas_salina.1
MQCSVAERRIACVQNGEASRNTTNTNGGFRRRGRGLLARRHRAGDKELDGVGRNVSGSSKRTDAHN